MSAPVRHPRRRPPEAFLGRLAALARLDVVVAIHRVDGAIRFGWRVPAQFAEAAKAIIADPALSANPVILFVEIAAPGSVRGLQDGESVERPLAELLAALDDGEVSR